MKIRDSYTCPLELTHDIIRGKWKPIIIWQLGKGAASPSTLQNDIVGIGQKMLLQHLSELQEIGIELMKEDGKEDFLKSKGLI